MGNGPAAEDPRGAFAAELTRLRRQLPGLTDEALARRAGAVVLPSGSRVAVNARRLGEWTGGHAVPRRFEAVMAVVHAVAQAVGTAAPDRAATAHWQRLWRAARDERGARDEAGSSPRSGHARRPSSPVVRAPVVVGRPPGDAAALRRRDGIAARIDAGLAEATVRRVLLTGAGGVGKSQLAAAAFHRGGRRARLLLWVPAGNRASVLQSYARAWRALPRLGAGGDADPHPGDGTPAGPYGTGGDDETQADLFLVWLRSTDVPWLIVLDDVDDLGEMAGLWPEGDAGRSLVTTRRRDAALLRPGVRVVTVGVFTADEAVGYLAERLAPHSPGGTVHHGEAMAALATALGCFPLALSQAAAFVIDTGTDLPSYLGLLGDERESLAGLLPSSSPADEHGGTVTGTLQLALTRAQSLAPPGTAAALLELISLLAPDGIPEAVLLGPAARAWTDGGRHAAGAANDTAPGPAGRHALLALRALHRLSLVTHREPGGTALVEAHSLVQRATRDGLPAARRAGACAAAADALEEVWSAPDCAPPTAALLHRCAESLLSHAGDRLWSDAGMHPLLRRLGPHLAGLGCHEAARATAQALAGRAELHLRPGHRDLLVLRAQLAQAEGDLGNTADAVRLLTRLRGEAVDGLGPLDPDTLSIRLHEARWRMESGLITDALADFVHLAAEARTVLPADDPLVTAAEEHTALCRGLSGDAVGARDAYAALARVLERGPGPLHPSTLRVLCDLSRWIGETGDVRTAVETYRRAVDGLDRVLGPLHHDTLIARHNLAYWHGTAGDLGLAIEQFTTAAQDASRALGAEHPTTLTCRANLAFWRGAAGETDVAVEHLGLLHRTAERVFGPDHPRSLRIRQQRAELLHRAGDHGTAVAGLAAVLADMERVQGARHPRTLETARMLADWTAERAAAP
ncbi:tetratricopeptide repeat protein [Streptomyces zhihengii]|uniref:tetratricopeptide repeat protein n=1 Tax=Streptomyces zhihengii TaxID=1818004 RepID=UPI003627C6D1